MRANRKPRVCVQLQLTRAEAQDLRRVAWKYERISFAAWLRKVAMREMRRIARNETRNPVALKPFFERLRSER